MALSSFFKDYLIPSGITVAVFAYFIGQLRGYRNSKELIRTKRLALIGKLSTDVIRINALFESLRIDAELNGYFAFKNIYTIRPMVSRIQSITNDELAVFEGEDKLRNNIIDTGDFLSSLLTDVDNLENIAQVQVREDKDAKNKLDSDVKSLRATILPFGFQVTPALEIVNPTRNPNDKIYNSTLSSLSEIKSTYDNSINNSRIMTQVLKDRRFFYCIKLLDAQNRLQNLIFLLENARKKYSKRSWIIKLLNKIAV